MSLEQDQKAMEALAEEFNARPHYTGKRITGIKFITSKSIKPGKTTKTIVVYNTGTGSCGYPLLPKWGEGLAVQVLKYLREDPRRSPSPIPFLSYDD